MLITDMILIFSTPIVYLQVLDVLVEEIMQIG